MTNRKQELMERLSREFDICDRHIQRIDEALEAMHTDIPKIGRAHV